MASADKKLQNVSEGKDRETLRADPHQTASVWAGEVYGHMQKFASPWSNRMFVLIF